MNKKFAKYRVRRIFKETVEPEEILLDATKAPVLEDQKIEVPIKRAIFQIFFSLFFVIIFLLTIKTAQLQLIQGEELAAAAEKNRLRILPIFASRGIIYDQAGQQLVYNAPSFSLILLPRELSKTLNQQRETVKKISELLNISAETIWGVISQAQSKAVSTAVVANDLDHEALLRWRAADEDFPGFQIEQNISRQYVDGSYFSQLIGYLGKLDVADLAEHANYSLNEKIGKNGLESFYEETLRGQPGQFLSEVDALGKTTREIAQKPPQDGQGLILAIDSRLQKSLQDNLQQTLKRLGLKKAVAVALRPGDGGVLALVSLPTFDNNIFSRSVSEEDYEKIFASSDQPLFNRAITGQYAPGSTVKPLIGAAALQEKIITPTTKVFDPGEITVVNQYNSQILYRFADWQAHGVVDLYSAIAQSCDVYFYTIGGGYGSIKGLGLEKLVKYFKFFGLGQNLGFDLPGEKAGLVPDEDWKKRVKEEAWYIGDTYHLSIGQGDLLVTPLQLAVATAAIVNSGKVMVPHLVDKIVDSDKNIIKIIEPKVLIQGFIDEKNLDIIKEGMRQTVTDGSARLLNDLTVTLGAKTGTAQVAGQSQPNAWVTVFAPFDKPEIVLVVLVENSGEGSQVAAPVARAVLEEYFNNK